MSCVIRDHHGRFLTAQAKCYASLLDAGMGEALACRDAVRLAQRLGLQHVELEHRLSRACSVMDEERAAAIHS